MRRQVKHIVKVILIFALIMCWGISLGYENNIERKNKVLNIYFENNNVTVETIKSIEENKKDISVVGWKEESMQSAVNPDLNRTVSDLKILSIKGNSALLFKGAVLFEDDKEGCLIDSDTSYKLFGSNYSIGREIEYDGRKLIVRGIHNGTKSNIIVQLLDDSTDTLNGLSIDGTNLSSAGIEEFKTQFGFQELVINTNIYYGIAKLFAMAFPIVALVLLLIKVFAEFFKAKKKPILKMIYLFMAIIAVVVFFKVTKVNISIPLDMIPNKWSDFDFWSKMWNEYVEKFEYLLYMKKYGVDIYNIENLIMAGVFSVITIILFVVNLKLIKISHIKELIYVVSASIICTFVSVLVIWSKYNFYVNITMMWLLYPLYLCGSYFMKVQGKYLVYEDNILDGVNVKEAEIDIQEIVS